MSARPTLLSSWLSAETTVCFLWLCGSTSRYVSAVSFDFIDIHTQELGCERVLANLQARRWDCIYRLDIQLRLNVSSSLLLDSVDDVDDVDFSASPQVYFDPSDSYRKAHALSAG